MSTWSDLKIELMDVGSNDTTWGNVTNTNLGTAIEEAIVGTASVAFSNADQTIQLTNTNGTQTARNLRLNLTGSAAAGYNLILGSGANIQKPYIINNGTNGTITVKNTTGNGVAVPAGKTMWVYNDGTNVVDAVTHLTSLSTGSLSIDTPLAVASGGTGGNTQASARTALAAAASGANSDITSLSGLTTALTVLQGGTGSNTASGARTNLSAQETLVSGTNIKTINGTSLLGSGNIDTTTGVIPSGVILLWSGSVASIPAGWKICDGTSGTPDLRDRFVVGAGSTYAVAATGGSKDAIVVSHTHTATVTDPGHTHTASVTDPGHFHNLPGSTTSGGTNQTQIGVNATSVNATSATATTGISVTNASNTTGVTVGVSTTGSSATNANLPPYYALCYIMKT